LLTIQPVFSYFLKRKLETVDEESREALQSGFKNHYQNLADYYNGDQDLRNWHSVGIHLTNQSSGRKAALLGDKPEA
jgi:hypothetical protein